MTEMKSNLAKVKSLGAAKNGTSTWIKQRVSAIIILIFSFWSLLLLLKAWDHKFSIDSFSFFDATVITILITASIYHGFLGIKEIIEDYISCRSVKVISILFFFLISLLTVIFFISSILLLFITKF